jgi:hypothetical protein
MTKLLPVKNRARYPGKSLLYLILSLNSQPKLYVVETVGQETGSSEIFVLWRALIAGGDDAGAAPIYCPGPAPR